MVSFVKSFIPIVTITSFVWSSAPATSTLQRPLEDESIPPVFKLNTQNWGFIPSVGTDKGLYNEGLLEGDIVIDPRRPHVKNAVADPDLLWPDGVVIYKIEDDVGCPDSFQCDMLMKAMDHYHRFSCIRFKEWTGEENYVSIFYNKEKSGACYSAVGRMGTGKQDLSLGQRCWYRGIVIHELGHAIGFWHEMNRPDRDSWIRVYWSNILPGFTTAFAKYDSSKVDTLGESFDYLSIMMYDEYAFSKDGVSPTLESTGGLEIGPIWKKRGLSPSDRRRLSKLYQCDGNKPLQGFPQHISCRFDHNTCGFQNGKGSKWQWKTVNATSGYVHCSSKDVGRKACRFVSATIPGRDARDTTRGPMGCVRFYHVLKSSGYATLKMEQAYLHSLTAQKYDRTHTHVTWKTSPSGNNWKHIEIPIHVTSPFKLIFTAEFEDYDDASMASLDVFEVFYQPCSNPTTDTTNFGFAPSLPPVVGNGNEEW